MEMNFTKSIINENDYSTYYDLFLAEQSFYDSILSVTESNEGLISLTEGVKETITKYLNRIMESLQKAWNNFQEIVGDKPKKYLDSIVDKIKSAAPDFKINQFKKYNSGNMDNIKIVPFDYEQMKECDTKEKLLSKFYSGIIKDPEKSIKENLRDRVVTGVQDGVQCSKDMLQNMFDFLTKEFPVKMKTLKNDITNINNSSNVIQQTVVSLPAETTTTEAFSFRRWYLTEDDTPQQGGNKKEKFEDGPSSNKGNFIKIVTTYIGVAVDFATAKMSLLKDIFSDYLNIIKHYFGAGKKKENNENEVKVSGEVKQVNTSK